MKKKIIFITDKLKMEPILANKKIPPGAKLILFNLIHRAGKKNYAFPSQKTIAKDIGLGERQVRIHLKKLNEKGIIKWNRGAINPKTGFQVNSNNYDLSSVLIAIEVNNKNENK